MAGTDGHKTIIRTANLDAPAWETLPCGIAFMVTRHGRKGSGVRVLLKVPVDSAEKPPDESVAAVVDWRNHPESPVSEVQVDGEHRRL